MLDLKNKKVIVRFAPSPTGSLHIGGLRVALYNYLFAKQHGGQFILRLEDTDQARLVPGADQQIINNLAWAGLKFDQGPFYQSQRLKIYRQYVDELLKSGWAYRCFCSPSRLEEMRAAQIATKQPPMYDRQCLNLSETEVQEKLARQESHVVRLQIPRGQKTTFDDLVRGQMIFDNNTIDDQILLKTDGFPTYHLAAVVDDHLMQVSHVLRGEEWLSSTPKHIILYQAFGWTPPQFAHLPNILNADKKKLSKRQGDVAVDDYIKQGYLPQAILNFVALLGWHPADGQTEILSFDQLLKHFDLNRVQKAGAVFDRAKLDWLSNHYIKELAVTELVKECHQYLPSNFDEKYLSGVVALFQERLNHLSEITALTEYFFTDQLNYDKNNLVWKKSNAEKTKINLQKLINFLENYQAVWSASALEEGIVSWLTDHDLAKGDFLWPMRYALTGREQSPGPFEVAGVLGKEKTLQRLKTAQQKL